MWPRRIFLFKGITMTKIVTKIVLIRSNSKGLAGTIANAQCHAQPLLPLVNFLASQIAQLGFDRWVQGHNIHVLETVDGRKFVLRPVARKDEGYCGIQVYLRHSRSKNVPLMTLFIDGRNGMSCYDFCGFLKNLAESPLQPMSSAVEE